MPPPPAVWEEEPIKPAVLGTCGKRAASGLISYVAPKRTRDMLGSPPAAAGWNDGGCGPWTWCSLSLLAGTGGALLTIGSRPSSLASREPCAGVIDSAVGAAFLEEEKLARREANEAVEGSVWTTLGCEGSVLSFRIE